MQNLTSSSASQSNTSSSEVYYFWLDAETNTYGVTIADSETEGFSPLKTFTIDELSAITAPESENGNGEGAAWGDAIVSNDGSRIFVNARNADKVAVINTETRDVETILDVGDRPVHSFIHNNELWVHVDGDGGFNVIDMDTLEVSELIETNTVGTGHGKLLVSSGLGNNTYVTTTAEPAVFPINLDTREVGAPIEIGGGDPDLGTHDKGYDPATGLAFFQLTGGAGFSFIDTKTNEVVFDQVPILGRVTHTPDDDYILILNAGAESEDVGIWNTQLPSHTQPAFDSSVTIGGGVSYSGTEFYQEGDDWEAWIAQTKGDNIAILNLETNALEYVEVGNLTVPEGARHFSRIAERDGDYYFTYSDEGALRIDLDTQETSAAVPLGGSISRMAIVNTGSEFDMLGTAQAETLVGTDNNDRIHGMGGDDTVAGGMGHDFLMGGDGDDVLRGDRNSRSHQDSEADGNDVIFGGAGSDRIGGKAGNDILVGEMGNDFIWGDAGDDIVMGGSGNDTLMGDNGSGSGGSDIFVFAGEAGTDTILDFTADTDVIGLVEGTLTFAELSITQTGENTSLGVASSGQVLAILNGVSATQISENSFTTVADVSNSEVALAMV